MSRTVSPDEWIGSGREERGKVSSVRYVRFKVPDAQALIRGPVALAIDHPAYSHWEEIFRLDAPLAGAGPDMKKQKSEVERFAQYCRSHGLSVTHQRLAIFEALAASREHPSAKQLHRAVQRRIPTLSLATVYKNLEALKAIGAVMDVNPLHEEGRYEAALPGAGAGRPHHHLVCISCKKVRGLYDGGLDRLRISDAQGFDVRAIRVQAEGLCPECRARSRS